MFCDNEYIKRVIMFDKVDISDKSLFEAECEKHTLLKDEKSEYRKRAEKAFELAHDIRKFEIELFWKRGTYYWAYIIGSYAAYFAVLNKTMPNNCSLSLDTMFALPRLTKIVLCSISFLCFFFCLAWVLINKGSKFWQKNWEEHIDNLENEFSGKLYKSFLNTNNIKFCSSIFSEDAYDYSVTKITWFASLIMTIFSCGMWIFNFIILCCNEDCIKLFESDEYYVKIILIIGCILLLTWFFFMNKGNTDNKNNEKYKWFQRKTYDCENASINIENN